MDTIIEIIRNAVHILVFPGLLFASFAGLLLAGLDRKILARMQKRKGPPVLQPTYDFLKLMGKETIIPHAANKWAFLGAPIIGFASLVVLMLFLPVAGYEAPFAINGDLIIILYLLTIPAVALIIGGSASGSPFAGIGISREMVAMMAYELPLVIVLLAVAKKAGGETLAFSLQTIIEEQAGGNLFITNWQLIPAVLAMLLVIPAEVGTQPFDVAEAETEICEGPLIEYSGAPLAMFKLNTAIKMFVMTALFSVLFLGGINLGIAGWYGIVLNVVVLLAVCALITILCMTLIHAICARLKIEHMFKFYWTTVTALAAISLILVWIF